MLYIDASRYNITEKRTGVENYSYFLINALVDQYPDQITLISPKKIPLQVAQLTIPFPRLWTHLRLSWEVFKNKKIQNLFVPSHVLPLIYAKKSVITIHDVAFFTSPKSYSPQSRWYLNWAAKFAVKHAYKIITPSEKSKADLMKYYHCPANKIQVIPLGFSPPDVSFTAQEVESTLKKYALQKKAYFLYTGRIEYKKNSDTLIKAFEAFHSHHPQVKLVMAGFVGHGGQAILDSIPEKLRPYIILPGYISEAEKQILLQNARAFVFPSREEGFGIPLLEAMHAGLPILASNIPTSKEIASNNALFFEVEDAPELQKLMGNVMKTEDSKILKTETHQKTLARYSWERCAREVFGIWGPPPTPPKEGCKI